MSEKAVIADTEREATNEWSQSHRPTEEHRLHTKYISSFLSSAIPLYPYVLLLSSYRLYFTVLSTTADYVSRARTFCNICAMAARPKEASVGAFI